MLDKDVNEIDVVDAFAVKDRNTGLEVCDLLENYPDLTDGDDIVITISGLDYPFEEGQKILIVTFAGDYTEDTCFEVFEGIATDEYEIQVCFPRESFFNNSKYVILA